MKKARRWEAIKLDKLSVVCDGDGAGGCGYSEEVPVADIDAWSGRKCPGCERVLVTPASARSMKKLLGRVRVINVLFGWVGLLAKPEEVKTKMIGHRVRTTGRIDLATPANHRLLTEPELRHVCERRWDNHPPLSTQMPLVLGNGSVLNGVTVSCGSCDEELADPYAHGEFVPIDRGFKLNSVSWCPRCDQFTFGEAWILEGPRGWVMEGTPAGSPRVPLSPWREDGI